MTKHSPVACLKSITITTTHLVNTYSLEEEFRVIKKVYHEKILKEHPDKGGDPVIFRETRAAFEVLRNLYQEGTVKNGTFSSYFEGPVEDDIDIDELYETYASADSYPSYSYYEEAAATPVPGYRVEKAKSNRSSCKCRGKNLCGTSIPKDSIRVGSLDDTSGSYGRWRHLTSVGESCKGWRVPKKVWNGLTCPFDIEKSLIDLLNMEEVLLCGLASLDEASRQEFVLHCVQEQNWAGYKRKIGENRGGERKKKKTSFDSDTNELAMDITSLTNEEEHPKPIASEASVGFPLANPNSIDTPFLHLQSFLITGSFPELVKGATMAKDAGVGDVKVLIEKFGGKVSVRFSKKTSYLIVGKDPSRQRFLDAETREIPILTLNMLNAVLNGTHSFEDIKTLPALAVEAFEGMTYKPGGGPLPPITASAPPVNIAPTNAKQVANEKSDVHKLETKKSSSTKTGENVKRKKASQPPSDRASVVAAALAAANAGMSHSAMETRAVPSVTSSSTSIIMVSVASDSSSFTRHAIVPAAPSSMPTTIANQEGKKARFFMPKPGVNGAVAGILNGKKLVLTGTFPEVGGGSGLNLGKDRMVQMIESFGGKVTGSVSGKTDYVIVGRNPGASKVGKAHQRSLPLLDILSLERLLLGRIQLDQIADEPPPQITNFSTGYGGNGLLCDE